MKRIPADALAQTALSKGATIQVDGKRINAAAERVDVPHRRAVVDQPPAPVAPAAPEPAALDTSGLERIAQAQADSTARMVQLVAMLLQEARVKPAAESVREWDFDVERDAQGRLMKIRATAR